MRWRQRHQQPAKQHTKEFTFQRLIKSLAVSVHRQRPNSLNMPFSLTWAARHYDTFTAHTKREKKKHFISLKINIMNGRFSNKYLNFFMFDDFDILLLRAAHLNLYILLHFFHPIRNDWYSTCRYETLDSQITLQCAYLSEYVQWSPKIKTKHS